MLFKTASLPCIEWFIRTTTTPSVECFVEKLTTHPKARLNSCLLYRLDYRASSTTTPIAPIINPTTLSVVANRTSCVCAAVGCVT